MIILNTCKVLVTDSKHVVYLSFYQLGILITLILLFIKIYE